MLGFGAISRLLYRVQWHLAVVPLALLLFIFLAGNNVQSPGLYYDELLFVNAALGGKINMFIHSRFGDLPLMLMPYIGALKAWIYYPIFKIFGVTTYSIRWPVVAIGALTLWINYRFVKMAFSRSIAIVFLILAAVEPSTLFHTRLDWGPTTLMMLFRALLLLSVFAWIKTEKPWWLFVACAAAVFGVYDKLNFIWFCSAAFISLLVVYPDRIIAFVRTHLRSAIVIALLGATCVAGFVFYTRYHLPLENEIDPLDWALRWQYVMGMLRVTFGGIGVYGVVVGNGDAMASTQLLVLGLAGIAALVVLVITRKVPGEWRALSYIVCFILITLLQMFVTRQATGPHHSAMFAPLWLIPIAVLLGRAFGPGSSSGWILKGVSIAAIASVVVSSLLIDAAYLKGFSGQVKPHWDAGSNDLVEVIKANPGRAVICVDWGLGTIIYGLSNGEVEVSDDWPTFKNGLTTADAEMYEQRLLSQNPLFVVPAEGKEAFPETRKHFFEAVTSRNWKLERFAEIKGQVGDVLVEVYSVKSHPAGTKILSGSRSE